MKAVFLGLLSALGQFLIKMLTSLAGEAFMKWLFFYSAEVIVKQTDTPHDNAFLEKIKEVFEDSEKGAA